MANLRLVVVAATLFWQVMCKKGVDKHRLETPIEDREKNGPATQVCSAGKDGQRKCGKEASPLLRNGRVAILMRGQSFRGPSLAMSSNPNQLSTCHAKGKFYKRQILATRSFVTMVLNPLESHGNKVDIFISDGPCDEARTVHSMYGENRTLAKAIFVSESQGDGVRRSLDQFKLVVGGNSAVGSSYDLVISTRHDIHWKLPIDSWPVSFSRLNFRWIRDLGKSGSICDIFFMMPGSLFRKFEREVGKGQCLPARSVQGPSTGHLCYDPMVASLGATNVGALCMWTTNDHCNDHMEVLIKPSLEETQKKPM